MNDAQAVRLGNRLANLEQIFRRGAGIDRTGRDDGGEISALKQLHHDVGAGVAERPDVEYPGDVLAAQLGRRARFAQEPLHRFASGHRLRPEALDRNPMTEVDVGGLEHQGDAALTEQPLDTILSPDDLSGVHPASIMSARARTIGPHRRRLG